MAFYHPATPPSRPVHRATAGPRLAIWSALAVLSLLGGEAQGQRGPCERLFELTHSAPEARSDLEDARRACLPEGAVDARAEIPGGHWQRAVDAGERAVSLDPFDLDRFEVTVGDFRGCLAAGSCRPAAVLEHVSEPACNLGAPSRDRHPINCLTWQGAKAFCEYRGGRLPTEAELEWASSAGGGSLYPWSWATPPSCDQANFRLRGEPGCGRDATSPVGSYPRGASREGVHDLVGNVAEWAADGFVEALPAGAFHNPVASGDSTRHAVRGGSWRDTMGELGSRARQGRSANAQDAGVGFRCAYEPDASEAASARESDGPPRPTIQAVTVPAGPFPRGSPRDVGDSDEQPQRRIDLDDFRIARLETTVYQFRECVQQGGCRTDAFESYHQSPGCNYDRPGYGQHPMNCISWLGAQELCHWLGGRLPTEAEWEKAARGVDSRAYPWGNEDSGCGYANQNLDGLFASSGCGTGGTLPAGTFYDGLSPYLVFDMAGNVAEWVADWYDDNYYALAPDDDPPGPLSGSSRVVRGGSWNDEPSFLRSGYRSLLEPDATRRTVGFRCVWEE